MQRYQYYAHIIRMGCKILIRLQCYRGTGGSATSVPNPA